MVHGMLCGGGGAAAASSTLLDGLVSWWSLDEASGTRVDSHGSNDLTDVNTVGSASGKVSNAASCIKTNTEYLTCPHLGLSGSASISMWVYITVATANAPLFFDANGSSYTDGWGMTIQNISPSLQPRLLIEGSYYSNPGGAPGLSLSTWYHLVAVHDDDANTIALWIDGTEYTQAHAGGLTVPTGQAFYLNHDPGGGRNHTLLIDEVAAWGRAITADEVAELYNGGSGIGYPG